MAAPFRVRDLAGVWHAVDLAPTTSETGAKEAVAAVVGLAPGTFGLTNDRGDGAAFRGGLTGDWHVAKLPTPPGAGAGAGVRAAAGGLPADFEALARAGGVCHFVAAVAARAKTRYALRVANALAEQSAADAARIFFDAEQLPFPRRR